MKIIGIIPARFDSTRLPGKPLADINGKPMIQHVYESASKSTLLSRVIVATDSSLIYDAVQKFGGEAIMTTASHNSGTERIAEAVKNIEADLVVNIQGDEPFIDAGNINIAVQPLIDDKNIQISTLAIKFEDINDIKDPNKVKVVFDKNNIALYFSRSVIPFSEEINNLVPTLQRGNGSEYYKHIGLYVYRKDFLMKLHTLKHSMLEEAEKLEQLRFLENGYKIKVVLTEIDSVSVDTEEDLNMVRHFNKK